MYPRASVSVPMAATGEASPAASDPGHELILAFLESDWLIWLCSGNPRVVVVTAGPKSTAMERLCRAAKSDLKVLTVLPYALASRPPWPSLLPEHRLERELLRIGGDLVLPADRHIVTGDVLEAKLPQSLIVALLDDRARVESNTSLAQLGWNVKGLEKLRQHAQKPSSLELFRELAKRCAGVVGINELLGEMILHFEMVFEGRVLYPSERVELKELIELATRDPHHPLYTHYFGAYFFLRHLTVFVTVLTSQSPLEKLTSPAASSDSAKARIARIGDSEERDRFSRLQEIIDTAVDLLHENAHLFFV